MTSRYQAGKHQARVSGLHSHTREYTVRFYVAGKHQAEADYFTPDKADAHDTAAAEIARLHQLDAVSTNTRRAERGDLYAMALMCHQVDPVARHMSTVRRWINPDDISGAPFRWHHAVIPAGGDTPAKI